MKQFLKYNLHDLEWIVQERLGSVTLHYREEKSSSSPPVMTVISSEQKSINNVMWYLFGKIDIHGKTMFCRISLVYNTQMGWVESDYPILTIALKNGIWKIV